MKAPTRIGRIAPQVPEVGDKWLLMAAAQEVEVDREAYDNAARNFRLGSDTDREAFIKRYGVEDAIGLVDRELQDTEALEGAGTGGSKHREDMKMWRERLRERQGDTGVPTS